MSEAMETGAFQRVVALADVAEGKGAGFVVGGWPVLVARVGGQVHAMLDRCSHQASVLSTGRIRRGAVSCPLHGALFDLATGKCPGAPYKTLPVFPVQVTDDDWIEVAVPAEDPPLEYAPLLD